MGGRVSSGTSSIYIKTYLGQCIAYRPEETPLTLIKRRIAMLPLVLDAIDMALSLLLSIELADALHHGFGLPHRDFLDHLEWW